MGCDQPRSRLTPIELPYRSDLRLPTVRSSQWAVDFEARTKSSFFRFGHLMSPAVFAQGFGVENVQVALRFADGSVGAIDYFNVADSALGKEHFEAFGSGKHVIVDDIREKGQAEEVRQFVAAVKVGTEMPIAFDDILASTRATFAILKSMRTGQAVEL